jgi:putative hemolysin
MLQMRKYLKEYVLHPDKVSLLKVMDKPVFVQTGKVIDDLLEALSAERTHVAVVRDEQQKVVGIITVEDILEELVGEIYEDDKGEEAQ